MKNELAMRLFSRRPLTESAAEDQIVALSEFRGGLMRPDKCSEVEPIRTRFDETNIGEPIRWLAKPHGEFLYQKGRPIEITGAMWNLTRPPTARFSSPLFTNYWTGDFDGEWASRVGIEKVEDFLVEIFRVTASDFGLLTTEIDLRAKNRPLNSYSYAGMDLESGVPGLYWINFFSAKYGAWLGVEHLPPELAVLSHLSNSALSLKFCDLPGQCRSLEVLDKQRTAVEWLGPEKFFDVHFPNRKAVTPDWEHLPLPQF